MRKLASLVVLAASLVCLGLIGSPAKATTYDVYSFNGVGLTGLITVDDATGQIVAITGSVAGYGNIANLVNNPNFPGTDTIGVGGGTNFTFDNLGYPTDPHLDGYGLVFKFVSGLYANLWGNSPGNYELFIGNYVSNVSGAGIVAFDSAFTTPLPSTWTMLIAGFAGFGYFAYRGMKKTTSAVATA